MSCPDCKGVGYIIVRQQRIVSAGAAGKKQVEITGAARCHCKPPVQAE